MWWRSALHWAKGRPPQDDSSPLRLAEVELIDVIKGFPPSWFAAVCGTGIMSAIIQGFPYAAPAKLQIGWAFWWLTLFLFCLFTGLMVTKFVMFPSSILPLLLHPVLSMFLGLVPIALLTVVGGFPDFLLVYWDPAHVNTATVVLWSISAGLAGLASLIIPFFTFTRQEQSWANLSAVWLLPILPGTVAAAVGGLVAEYCGEGEARQIIVASGCLLGTSLPLGLMVIGLYLGRLAVYKLPPKELIVSCFLPVGVLSKSSIAFMLLGSAALRPEQGSGEPLLTFAPGFQQAGVWTALLLWGAAAWWLVMAVVSVATTIPELPFTMGWWGFVFPIGVFAEATVELAAPGRLGSAAFEAVGAAFTAVALALWCGVAAGTLLLAWQDLRHLKAGPCLTGKLVAEKEAMGGPDLGLIEEEQKRLQAARADGKLA